MLLFTKKSKKHSCPPRVLPMTRFENDTSSFYLCVFLLSPQSSVYLLHTKQLGELVDPHHGGGGVTRFKRRLIWRAQARTHAEALSLVLIVCLCGWDVFLFIYLFAFFMATSPCLFLFFFSKKLNEYFKACSPNRCCVWELIRHLLILDET